MKYLKSCTNTKLVTHLREVGRAVEKNSGCSEWFTSQSSNARKRSCWTEVCGDAVKKLLRCLPFIPNLCNPGIILLVHTYPILSLETKLSHRRLSDRPMKNHKKLLLQDSYWQGRTKKIAQTYAPI